MTRRPSPFRLAPTILLLAAALAGGCGGDDPGRASSVEPATPPDGTYTVRAEVVAELDPERPEDRQLRIRHEAVPEFVGFEGEVVGMASMTMPFPVAPGVDLDGVEAGDPVEVTFEVRWEEAPPLRIVELRELPTGTELDFDTAEPLPGEVEVEDVGSQPP